MLRAALVTSLSGPLGGYGRACGWYQSDGTPYPLASGPIAPGVISDINENGWFDDIADGPVSAVGNFNGWQPGAHRLVRRSNGTRSVSVTVPAGEHVHFRYLGSGGVWFDDPDAHAVSEVGGFVRC